MRFDLLSLRVFIAAVEQGSISRAAEIEHLVPSAASRRLSELEEGLGFPLLVRLPNGVRPTAAGESLLRRAKSVVACLDQIPSELSRLNSLQTALRVLSNATALVGYLMSDVRRFVARHPNITIQLEEWQTQPIIRAVLDGETDMGVIGHLRPSGDLRVVPYRSAALFVVMTPDHPLSARTSVSFEETLDYGLVTLSEGTALGGWATDASARLSKKPKFSVRATTYDGLRGMVAAGLGIAVVPEPNIAGLAEPLGLRSIPLSDEWASMQLNLVLRPESSSNQPLEAFVQHLTAN